MSPEPHLRTLEVDNLSTSLDNTRTILMSLVALPVQRVSCGRSVWRPAPLLLLLLLVQLAATQIGPTEAGCPQECVPISQCPELVKLLENTTPDNTHLLRQATCTISHGNPTVCCPRGAASNSTSLLPSGCGVSVPQNKFNRRVAFFYEHPWMAVLGYSGRGSLTEAGVEGVRFLCTGSVISQRYVLTAAQCVHSSGFNTPGRRLEVIRLGEWDLSTEFDCERNHCAPPTQDFTYEEITVHPDYNTRGPLSDDIALIRLDRPANISSYEVLPVCLPPQDMNIRSRLGEQEARVAGWGLTDNGTISDALLNIDLPLVASEECTPTYTGNVADEQICVESLGDEDSCMGDYGGPLIIMAGAYRLQIGLMSHKTANCGQAGVAAVYTSLTHYRNWIEKNLKP